MIFFGMTPKAQVKKKSKNKQVGLHHIKKLCTAKGTINKVQRQSTEWEKIFVNHISDKGVVSKIHKELIQLNSKNTDNPNEKWAKDPE